MSDAVKVVEALARGVQELAPLRKLAPRCRRFDQLQDERAPRDDVGPPGQEVSAHQRLEHARLAAGLAAHHRYLGQVQLLHV